MKNPRINLEEFDKTVHKLLGITKDIKDEQDTFAEKLDRVVVRLALLKQELMSEIEWQENNGKQKEE